MKNYSEKEKRLENVLEKLNSMSNKVIKKMSNDNYYLNLEKNQLLREKEESASNFQILNEKHEKLKKELEMIDYDVGNKFGKKKEFNQKIDELNQETETLIEEIEKWQT